MIEWAEVRSSGSCKRSPINEPYEKSGKGDYVPAVIAISVKANARANVKEVWQLVRAVLASNGKWAKGSCKRINTESQTKRDNHATIACRCCPTE
jgi:hypothetical protein